jgi:hypothetical protein
MDDVTRAGLCWEVLDFLTHARRESSSDGNQREKMRHTLSIVSPIHGGKNGMREKLSTLLRYDFIDACMGSGSFS